VIALGDVLVTGKEITMTHTRYSFVKPNGHADIVSKLLDTFLRLIDSDKHKLVVMATTGRQYIKPSETD
jgi:hypothetical protein